MVENNQTKLFSKKAYEIAYALFRVAGSLNGASFRDAMEKDGLDLLLVVVSGDYAKAKDVLNGVDYLLRFGADVGVLNHSNAETILREAKAFNSAIAESSKPAIAKEVSIENIFSKDLYLSTEKTIASENSGKNTEQQNERWSIIQDKEADDVSIDNAMASSGRNGSGVSIVKSAMRQAAILERIRQNGNCRLKDIQEFLPEVSERTIRYDIQDLIGEGSIERLGNGGPATYYQMRSS